MLFTLHVDCFPNCDPHGMTLCSVKRHGYPEGGLRSEDGAAKGKK